MQKNWLCAEFDHVQLDLNHLKTGSGNRFFGGILLCFCSGEVSWGHGRVTNPRWLRMGWAYAEKLGCVRTLTMYD